MLTLIPFGESPKPRTNHTKWFRFTLTDDTVVRKKLKASIAAQDEKPRVNVFEDETFTVGTTPTVYKAVIQGDGKSEWEEVFTFKMVHIEYEEEGPAEEDDKKDV